MRIKSRLHLQNNVAQNYYTEIVKLCKLRQSSNIMERQGTKIALKKYYRGC